MEGRQSYHSQSTARIVHFYLGLSYLLKWSWSGTSLWDGYSLYAIYKVNPLLKRMLLLILEPFTHSSFLLLVEVFFFLISICEYRNGNMTKGIGCFISTTSILYIYIFFREAPLSQSVFVLKRSRELLPFSTGGFCLPWAHLRTPALPYDRCTAPRVYFKTSKW